MSSRESFEEDTLKTNSLDFSENDTTEKSDNRDIGQPRKEQTYLQQSKKKVYIMKCRDIFNDILSAPMIKDILEIVSMATISMSCPHLRMQNTF